MEKLNFEDFECLNAIVGQTEYDNQTVYRYLCTKIDTKIHIIRIFERNDLYIMKELSSASVYSGNYFRDESHFESAFDKFELRQCIADDIMWYFPKQLIKFLTQTKNSRFIDCDKKLTNYSIGSDRRKFKHSKEELELTKFVKINQICQKSELSIFMFSSLVNSVESFERREATRQTWGSNSIKSLVNVFFVIAEPNDDKTQKELESEAFLNKDMIQFGFRDNYYNLTLKSIALLRWAHENCFHSKYILKIEDNVIVNVEHLLKNLNSFLSGMTGYLMSGSTVVRNVNSVWFVPECIHPNPRYPDFMISSGYLMTKNSIKPLLDTLEQYSSPVFDIEDVFITGVLAEKAMVERHSSDKFKFRNGNDVCLMFDTFALMNSGSANDMIELWKKWKQTSPESCGIIQMNKTR